jgi:predicted transcriptional regulator
VGEQLLSLLQDAADLLFELGSEDRIRILIETGKTRMKLGELSKTLSSTIQEASRQTARLEEAGLLEKYPDATYGPTTAGRISISLLPAFVLLHEERDYFASHDSSSLPSVFVERVGELLEHRRIGHIDDALKFQQRVIKESSQYVWFMSDQPVGHALRPDHSQFSNLTSLRLILPKGTDTEVFREARNRMGSRFQIGLVEQVKIVLALNEKIAAFGLPTKDGRIDYSRGFYGDNSSFQTWCRDLFSHYWEKAIKVYAEVETS